MLKIESKVNYEDDRFARIPYVFGGVSGFDIIVIAGDKLGEEAIAAEPRFPSWRELREWAQRHQLRVFDYARLLNEALSE